MTIDHVTIADSAQMSKVVRSLSIKKKAINKRNEDGLVSRKK